MKTSNKIDVFANTEEINIDFNDNKWGKQLDDYQNYVKEYIKHYKKAQKGNEVSLALYPYMRVKWEALNKRLNSATKQNLLSEKQIRKVIKIQTKIVNTCSE